MDRREENFNRFLEELVEGKIRVSYNPFELFIALTNVCNLNCAFCPFCGFCMKKIEKPEMIPLDIIKCMAEYFQTAKVLIPSGRGEPFLYKYFDEFIDICDENDVLCKMQLTNNGTQIGKYNLEKLKNVNIIGISFDAADAKTFEILRYRAKFQNVINNINKIRQVLPENMIMFNVVVNRLNLTQIAAIYKLARELEVNFITYNGIYGDKEDRVISLLRLRESDKIIVEQQMAEIKYLNQDNKIRVENVITFNGFEDNEKLDYDKIYEELNNLKDINPYLNYDEINKVDMDSRRIKLENKFTDHYKDKVQLPYCTSPWTILDMQPNGDVCPCCASYGTIDSVIDKTLDEVWNGENIMNLRESMFHYSMIPDICKECNSWMRYNYINEYLDKLKESRKWNGEVNNLIIPPNYNPPEGFIKEKLLMERILMEKDKYSDNKITNLKINSESYWDKRFDTDWDYYGGSQQTEFFAKIAWEMFPEWFIREIKSCQYTFCDMGCAMGNGVNALSKLLGIKVTGMDFSEEAIKKAKEVFPQYEFRKEDVTNLSDDRRYDIVFCSNVLEHFSNPWDIAGNFTKISSHYIVLLVPFREKLDITEHVYKFDTDLIPLEINKFHLVYLDTINGENIDNTYYPDQQVLLIYSNNDKDSKLALLKDITSGISKSDIMNSNSLELDRLESEKNALVKQLENEKAAFSRQLDDVKNEMLNQLEAEKSGLLEQLDEYTHQIEIIQSNNDNTIKKLTGQIEFFKLNERKIQNQISGYIASEEELKREITQLKEKILEREVIIQKALTQCKNMIYSRLFRGVHLLNRFIYQGIKGDKLERRKFRKWFRSCLIGGGDADHRYHPLFSIINILESNVGGTQTSSLINNNAISVQPDKESELAKHLKLEESSLSVSKKGKSKESLKIEDIIKTRKYNGILIYPHVVYWEPLQTPQQLLKAFSEQGWLCFFCEHNNIKECCREVEPNLIITHEKDLLMALGDTKVTILLTWLGSLSFVKNIKNANIWYHILDKLDIFPYYDSYYQSLHNEVVKKAQYVSYVAKPLLDCITNREDAIYLPNGSNPDELLNQHEGFIPSDMRNIVSKGNKIIGYYGYLAEWMNYDLVAEVAKERPNYEFVFIGKSIYDTSKIENIPNVHLLGLKPYKELSDYAKLFDVATIPFVISDTMDCVSPIKFYEYCALGLPVITSQMKEMTPFVCEYVACINNKDEYLFYLDKFVQNDIKLLANKEAPHIANQNTWLSRAKKMNEIFNKNQLNILANDYFKYDVIILAVIDYDFRYQRPQHLAARFAKNGHRVFYVNANHFKETSIVEVDKNLFIVNLKNDDYAAIHLTDWQDRAKVLEQLLDNLLYQYCIRDAVTLVDYPNWVYGAEYLRNKYGFKVITDYMDDYTGFFNPAEKLVGENCVKLLKISDFIIPSSQFLYDIAKKYNDNISIVRNGTEFDHFYQATFEQKKAERKVVGYYGAVAQWFDMDKVCYIAENLKECDIVIIGEVTEGRKRLQKYSNIKLLGEVAYIDLPKHLACFDVCLIPFDTSTDLIKATNPVKFYEYLSAGKKVVATEIPELEPFKDKYVYLTNDNKKFLEYVKLCLDGTDTLADFEECIEFGKANDWQERYEIFSELCANAIPKVSIIVLTYNNLKLNKICINSILNKTAYPNYELIIVDNNSTDGTKEYLEELKEKKLPNIKVIVNVTNSGFAGGNNIGIKASTGDYVLLLNNDTIISRGWITSLVKHMENNEKLGMCGPVTNSIGNEAKIKVNYNTYSEMESFSYNYTWENMQKQYKNPDVLALFCTLIKREVINRCGMLDEAYGIGMFEDDDYAEAVKKAGYQLTIAEDSFIHHCEGASFKKLEDEKFRTIFEENKDRFEKKWNKKWKNHNKREGIKWDTNADINIID